MGTTLLRTGPFLAKLRRSAGMMECSAGTGKVFFVSFDNFLSMQKLNELTNLALAREPLFQPSRVFNQSGPVISDEHRRSRVLYEVEQLRPYFVYEIARALPAVLTRLHMSPFSIAEIELQITATNDGDFFRCHTDNSHAIVRRRTISFTCFFHHEPASFDGGELCLYDHSATRQNSHLKKQQNKSVIIRPKRNRIVFFPSHIPHEIKPVSCPSRSFENSRFTLNGWIYRADV